jgi:hypothetical protein
MTWLVLTVVIMGAAPLSPKGDRVVALRTEMAKLHAELEVQRAALEPGAPTEQRARVAHLRSLETKAEAQLAVLIESGGQKEQRRADASLAELRAALRR